MASEQSLENNKLNLSNHSGQLRNVENACFQQQNISAFLQFTGPLKETGEFETFQFDRPLKFSAVDNTLIVTSAPGACPANIQFDTGVFVSQPNIEACKRITDCNQVVNIIENSVYLDINAFQSIRITPGTIIEASNSKLRIITPDFCEIPEIPENIIELLKSGKIDAKITIVETDSSGIHVHIPTSVPGIPGHFRLPI